MGFFIAVQMYKNNIANGFSSLPFFLLGQRRMISPWRIGECVFQGEQFFAQQRPLVL